MSGSFSIVQKIALAGVVIGSMFCLIGISAPYWIVLDNRTLQVEVGLWSVCTKQYGLYRCDPYYTFQATMDAVRACAVICLLLGGACSVAALLIAFLCHGASTVAIGLTAFIGGIFGMTAIGVFVDNSDEYLTLTQARDDISYGWAFALFVTGTSILILASVAAGFASPDSPRPIQVRPTAPSEANVTRMNVQSSVVTTGPMNVQSPVITTGPMNVQSSVVTTGPMNVQSPVITTWPMNVQSPVVTTWPMNVQSPVVTTGPMNVQSSVITTGPMNVQSSAVTTGPMNVQSHVVTTGPTAPGIYWGEGKQDPYYPKF